MDILAYTADDVDAVTDAVELRNAASKVDAPWEHPETVRSWTGLMRYGWDGELPVGYVARQDGRIPIRHVGRVDASTLDDAVVFAATLYEEWKWTDMFIVPRREIRQLVKPA